MVFSLAMMAEGMIRWCSCKQRVVATSTCEGEYIILSAGCKKACWLRRLLMGIVSRCSSANSTFSDSQSAIKLAWNEGINRRNKHIDVAYRFVCNVVSLGEAHLEHTLTSEMVSHSLTKSLK